MNAETELQAACDEVFKKIGRNLLSFQLAEQILKELLRLGGLAIRSGAPEEPFGEIAKRAQKMTLGGLTTLFTETHCSGNEPAFPELPEDSTEGMIAISFAFNLGGTGLVQRQESLANLVMERNKLVHHFLPEFDRDSLDSCRALAVDLDRQREAVLPEIKRLQQDFRFVSEELSQLLALMTSPEGISILRISRIQQHPLIEQFVTIARNSETPDAWISLNAAAGSITDYPRGEMSEICESFGHKSLTALMIASQLFHIELQPAGSDRNRVLYRLKLDAGPPAPSHLR
ncbi:MAG: hypothetical protein RLZZ398_2090 [Verrucomicrobiota bacterium]|jgi:hypothetical protein